MDGPFAGMAEEDEIYLKQYHAGIAETGSPKIVEFWAILLYG
jgi:hypothetical protein